MSSYPGGVRVTGFIAPSDSTDTYPTHDSQFGLGGHHEAADHTERDAIPAARRREGMTCYTVSDGKMWQLQGGILNADWADITGGGGGSAEFRSLVTLGATFSTNQAFKIVAGIAVAVTSSDTDVPMVDGITLDSGQADATIYAAMIHGRPFTTPLALPGSDGDQLYLGSDGKVTQTAPISGWLCPIAVRDDSTTLIFNPQLPIKLA